MTTPSQAQGPVPTPYPRTPLTLWRLAVAFFAFYGMYMVLHRPDGSLEWTGLYELSQLGSLLVGVCYLGLACFPLFSGGRRYEPGAAWVQASLALMMLLIAVTSIFVLPNGGRLQFTGFFFEHLVTPVAVVLDFLLVGKARLRTRWWHPLTWLVPILAYFAFLLATGVRSYGALFSPGNGDFAIVVAAFIAGLIAAAYALYGVTRLLALISGVAPDGPHRPGASAGGGLVEPVVYAHSPGAPPHGAGAPPVAPVSPPPGGRPPFHPMAPQSGPPLVNLAAAPNPPTVNPTSAPPNPVSAPPPNPAPAWPNPMAPPVDHGPPNPRLPAGPPSFNPVSAPPPNQSVPPGQPPSVGPVSPPPTQRPFPPGGFAPQTPPGVAQVPPQVYSPPRQTSPPQQQAPPPTPSPPQQTPPPVYSPFPPPPANDEEPEPTAERQESRQPDPPGGAMPQSPFPPLPPQGG